MTLEFDYADDTPLSRDDFNRALVQYFMRPHTAKTHTEIVWGNSQDGHTLKIICDSTGGISLFEYDCVARRETAPNYTCAHCGARNARWPIPEPIIECPTYEIA